MRILSFMLGLIFRLLLCVVFYGTPLIGVWLSSSLAAYLGGPQWCAWITGLLMFPIIPGIWELHAWSHRKPNSKAWLTPLDRLSLRTFAVGLVFLGVMLCAYPQNAFVSLSTRGDWMLDGVKDARAEKVRQVLFASAGALEWLYKATKQNPYKAHIDSEARKLAEEATRQREQEAAQERAKAQTDKGAQSEKKTEHDDEQVEKNASPQKDSDTLPDDTNQATEPVQLESKWPWTGSESLHPAVVNMPAAAETSIESVAHYIGEHEKDPTLRIKALHDYVADRIAYDSKALFSGNIPDQDAETTFKTRKSVCAGYANLLSALASAIDEKIIVVTGDARDPAAGDKLAGGGHAWNAARIGDHWYLIDSCWDSGYVSKEIGFTKEYRTSYFLPPPAVMIQDHFPEEENWQLLDKPLSQGEFLRQPMLNPTFQSAELRLISPRQVRSDVSSEALVIVKNPKNQWLMAGLEQNGKKVGDSTEPTNNETAQLVCPLPEKGTYRVNLFVNKQKKRTGSYDCVGSVDFVSR